MPDRVFVFGSNLQGRHGSGSALAAKMHHGAREGVGVGRTGKSYAIPTREFVGGSLYTIPLERIAVYVNLFIEYAKTNPKMMFHIVAIGTGSAGYTDRQMAPLFKFAPTNCDLPQTWKRLLGRV